MNWLTQTISKLSALAATLVIVSLLTSCVDPVEVNIPAAEPVLNIDAWINNKPGKQIIRLSFTQSYFDNDNLPPAASGATVTITDGEGLSYIFTEKQPGTYEWTPKNDERLGATGVIYTLHVTYQGETFASSCKVGRVPSIDSISFRYEEAGFNEAGYRAQFWARDPAGLNDTYWIKTYKNGQMLNKPTEINIAYDGGENAGTSFDGGVFVAPVRDKINANEEDASGKELPSLVSGDSLYVEIHSLTIVSFNYMKELIAQISREGGLDEIFNSPPMANVSTNIVNANPKGSPVVGFFNISVVSGLGRTFHEQ